MCLLLLGKGVYVMEVVVVVVVVVISVLLVVDKA